MVSARSSIWTLRLRRFVASKPLDTYIAPEGESNSAGQPRLRHMPKGKGSKSTRQEPQKVLPDLAQSFNPELNHCAPFRGTP